MKQSNGVHWKIKRHSGLIINSLLHSPMPTPWRVRLITISLLPLFKECVGFKSQWYLNLNKSSRELNMLLTLSRQQLVSNIFLLHFLPCPAMAWVTQQALKCPARMQVLFSQRVEKIGLKGNSPILAEICQTVSDQAVERGEEEKKSKIIKVVM